MTAEATAQVRAGDVPGDAPWWSFATAGRVIFGSGCSRFLAQDAASRGDRVLLVTDANLVAAGLAGRLASELRATTGLELLLYDGGQPEIGFTGAEECVAAVRGFGPSVVVGLGGGSNLDLAKVVATRLLSDRPVGRWAAEGVPASALPLIAVPTTAGTGSEVTSVAVLTDEQNQTKIGFASPGFLPRTALVDPVLTVSCPPAVTAHSGMDALSHAIEAFLAISFADKPLQPYNGRSFVGKNPASDALALQAVSLIGEHLRTAVTDGQNLAAREAMALGSLLAGMAFAGAGTGIVHALQYPLGAATKTPHGLGNATLLPAAIQFNLPVRAEAAAELARRLGATGDDPAAALPDLVAGLAVSVGITPNLRSLGVTENDLAPMAAAAARITRLTENNPQPAGEEELLGVLRVALDYQPAR
jgi:alcohol dehydrogenase class IV